MAPTITRELMTQYSAADGGPMPNGLFVRDVPDFIQFMRRQDNIMLKLVRPGKERDILKWEFGEGDLAPRTDAFTATPTTSDTIISVANGKYYQKWNIIRVPQTGEQMLVKGFPGTNQLEVTRNWPAGGTPTAITGTPTIQILGVAMPEGADAVDSPVSLGETFYTYPEIMEYTWSNSHRSRNTPNYQTKTDAFKFESTKKMKEAAKDLNSLLLHGLRNAGSPGGEIPSSLGGLRQFTSTYQKDMSSAPLAWLDIMTLAQTVYNDVGQQDMGKTFMGNMFTKRIWNSWFQKSRITGAKDSSLKLNWDSVDTDFGTMKFVLNYEMDDNELFLWNPEDAHLDHYKGGTWSTGLYSTKGWYDTGFVRGDYGAIFEAARRRMRWYGFTTNTSYYPNLDIPV